MIGRPRIREMIGRVCLARTGRLCLTSSSGPVGGTAFCAKGGPGASVWSRGAWWGFSARCLVPSGVTTRRKLCGTAPQGISMCRMAASSAADRLWLGRSRASVLLGLTAPDRGAIGGPCYVLRGVYWGWAVGGGYWGWMMRPRGLLGSSWMGRPWARDWPVASWVVPASTFSTWY